MSEMINFRGRDFWTLILGGSSGFGLATAKKLARCGLNVCLVHRDRRGAMDRIEREFDQIREAGVQFLSFNVDALSAEGLSQVVGTLGDSIGEGKVRILLHSIAHGSLKLLAPKLSSDRNDALSKLSQELGLSSDDVQAAVDRLFAEGHDALGALAAPSLADNELLLDDGELARTIFAMGTSLLTWTREIFTAGLFAPDARVIGLTSEGNECAWFGYAAVSAAKAALESVSRSIAVEFGPHGIRSNIVQAGITDTPALKMIPGSAQMAARARTRNPFSRLTCVEDIADVIALLTTDEASWINGSIIRADGGERIAG